MPTFSSYAAATDAPPAYAEAVVRVPLDRSFLASRASSTSLFGSRSPKRSSDFRLVLACCLLEAIVTTCAWSLVSVDGRAYCARAARSAACSGRLPGSLSGCFTQDSLRTGPCHVLCGWESPACVVLALVLAR